jgi:uncharacterized membrane protein
MLRRKRSRLFTLARVAIPIGAVAGIAALGFLVMRRRRASFAPAVATIEIARPHREVYAYFRKLEHLPRFMDHLVAVETLGDDFSRWTARLSDEGTVSWEVELVEIRPGLGLAWKSTLESPIEMRGRVTFTPIGDDATEVRLETELGITRTASRRKLAKLFAEHPLKRALHRFKQLLEAAPPVSSPRTVVATRAIDPV